MSGTITLGGKTLASHSNDTDEITLNVGNTSLKNDYVKLPTYSLDPAGVSGAMYFNSTSRLVRLYDGNEWVNVQEDLSPFSTYNTSSMAHSEINTQEAGSTKITTYGDPAWSVFTASSTSDFGAHDGHEGSPADWPAYIAIDFGEGIRKAVNRLDIVVHGNSFGYFELQGSNDAGSGAFYNSGTWTSLPFITSNNSQNNQNAGGQSSGYSDGTRLTFQYNNNSTYRYYRLWIKDVSQPAESLGTRVDGWAIYYWELYRV